MFLCSLLMLFTPDSGFVILRPTPLQPHLTGLDTCWPVLYKVLNIAWHIIRQFAFFSHLDVGKKRWWGSAGKMSGSLPAREQKNCGLKFLKVTAKKRGVV